MIEKVIKKRCLESSSAKEDLAYWLTRPPEERINAVEELRIQHHGRSARLQRSVRVIKRA